jgi:hypothetical protein
MELGEADAQARMDAIDRGAGRSVSGGPAVLEAQKAEKAAETLAPEEIKR